MWRLRSFLGLAAMACFPVATASAATLMWPGPAPCGGGLQACLNAAAAGDIVLVATNAAINENLTIDKSLTLKAANGFTPRLGPLHFVFLSNPNPRSNVIVFEDFVFEQGRLFAVQTSTGSFNVSMRHLNIQNTYNDGPAIQVRTGQAPPYGPVVFDLSNNQLTIPADSQFNGAQVISIEGGDAASMTGTVRGNRINHFDGGQSGAIGLFNLAANPFDIDVIANEIRGASYNTGIILFQFGNGTSNVRYLDNLVVGQINVAGAPGAYVVNISSGDATFEVTNNTAADGGIGILINGRDDLGASWSGTVANNIVSNMTGGGVQIQQPTQTSGTVDNDHNLVFDVAFNDFTPGAGTLFDDPLFAGGADYHLADASPARNAGNAGRVPADLTTDLDGNPRQVGVVDMGAYESSCSASGAAWPVCGAPVAVKPGGQFTPSLAADGSGGTFVSYSHVDSIATSNYDVWLNHLDANGNPVVGWPADGFPVCELEGDDQVRHSVVADGNGGAFVAWLDTRNDPDDFYWDVYLQRITASGAVAPGWPANGLAVHPSTPFEDETFAAIVSDASGGVFVAWVGDSGTRLVRILPSGAVHAAWPVDGRLVGAGGAQLLADGIGGAYVCWNTGTDLRIVRITALNTVAPGWAASGLLVGTGAMLFDIDLQLDGSHVNVAWVVSVTRELRASRITSGGSIASGWSQSGVVVRSTPEPKTFLTLARGGASGDAVVAWREDIPAPGGFQVFAQRLTPTGTIAPGWPPLGWNVVPDGTQLNAVPSCDGGTALSFLSGGIRAIRFTPTATVAPGWPAGGVLLCGGSFLVVTPFSTWSCPDGTGGIITAVPRVLPGPGSAFDRADIQAQCVRGDGTASEGFAGSTPAGSDVAVQVGPATVTFASVTAPGETWLQLDDAGPPPPWGLQIVPLDPPVYYGVSTTAQYQGPVETCITYDPADLVGPESGLQLLHYDATAQPPGWVNVTTSIDEVGNVICGSTMSLSPFIVVEQSPTDVSGNLPLAHRLFANVPNPFNPTTTIRYELPKADHVRLEVLDVAGRRVRTLVNARVEAGRHEVRWPGQDEGGRRVASGVYFYRLQAGSYVATRRMVLLK